MTDVDAAASRLAMEKSAEMPGVASWFPSSIFTSSWPFRWSPLSDSDILSSLRSSPRGGEGESWSGWTEIGSEKETKNESRGLNKDERKHT